MVALGVACAQPQAASKPRIPEDAGPFFPSLARVEGDFDPVVFDDVASCQECHPDAVHQWQSSAHANASFGNPWYRTLVDDLREKQGFTASRHCGGCHDPLLLLSGRMDKAIEPGESQALSGVTCLVCHSVSKATVNGNGSYVLDTSPVPYPEVGDEDSIAAHRARLAMEPLRSPALCASCHRGFLGPHTGSPEVLGGIDEPGQWRASAWAGSHAARLEPEELPRRECRSCHMPEVEAKEGDEAGPTLPSHRFAGGHSALAAAVGDPLQVAAVEAMTRSAATVDVWEEDGIATVVIRNIGVGHRFPGGARDMKNLWIQLRVLDVRGRLLTGLGLEDSADSYALQTVVLAEDGRPELLHRVQNFRTLGWDHTIAARDAGMVEFVLPPLPSPYILVARLVAERHRTEVQALVCAAMKEPRSLAFGEQARKEGRRVLDGCLEEPVLELASAIMWVGVDIPAKGGAARGLRERRYDRALAMLHLPGERLEEIYSWVDNDFPASVALKATALANQGRLEESLQVLEQLRRSGASGPAVERIAALAYGQVWRWPEAAAAATAVTLGAPGDSGAWRELARARGSAGDPAGSLEAAVAGLALAPRDLSMLRSQALALQQLGEPADAAVQAWLRYQGPQDDEALKLACDQQVKGCFDQRQPVVRLIVPPP